MPQILRAFLLVVLVNLLYLGLTALARKIRRGLPNPEQQYPDEEEMKKELMNPNTSNQRSAAPEGKEKSKACPQATDDLANFGCGACSFSDFCKPQDKD
ncbi:MAG: hypothetical protein Q4P08_02665 [Eubacteriales bacterium]|nr:hypothetical protein [Eubacteriales bacterium]